MEQIITQTVDPEMQAFDALISSVRHEMIIHRTRQFIEAERIEPLTPIHFPGALLDCQADKLSALRSDIAGIEYVCMRSSRLCRVEFTQEASDAMLQAAIVRGQAAQS